jgi:hypothetical protein
MPDPTVPLGLRCYAVLDYCAPRWSESELHLRLMLTTYRLLDVLAVLRIALQQRPKP